MSEPLRPQRLDYRLRALIDGLRSDRNGLLEECALARRERDEAIVEKREAVEDLACCRRTVSELRREIARLDEQRRQLERQVEQMGGELA